MRHRRFARDDVARSGGYSTARADDAATAGIPATRRCAIRRVEKGTIDMLRSALCLFILASSASSMPQAKPEIAPRVRTRIDYRARPFVDLHFWVRTLASRTDALPELPGLQSAVDTARALDADFKTPLAWDIVEGAVGSFASAREAVEGFKRLPEDFSPSGGKRIELRKRTVQLAEALAALEPAFLEKIWPEHQRAIEAANATFGELLTPKESVALEFLTKNLGFTDDGQRLPVYLVFQAPPPGAITHRDEKERGVCFVGVDGLSGSLLVETLLHELTHAFDVNDKGESVLALLRKQLEAHGITRRDRAWRDVPHTLMFVQAGETVRRVLAPAHVHYGESQGYYKKVAAIAELELPIWKAHLDGQKTREQALEEIVAGAVTPKKAK